MRKTVLKATKKINRKKLQHAKKSDILDNKFENLDGPIETQHLLISTLLPPAVKAFIAECESEVEKLCGDRRYEKQQLLLVARATRSPGEWFYHKLFT